MGIGDWGLGMGIGDWGLGPIPNPQSPIPNPQSPLTKIMKNLLNIKLNIKLNKKIINIKYIYFSNSKKSCINYQGIISEGLQKFYYINDRNTISLIFLIE